MAPGAIGATESDATTSVKNADQGSREHNSDKITGLHSPPDSNNAMTADGTDSELSELEDDVAEQIQLETQAVRNVESPAAASQPQPPPPQLEEAETDDVGDIEPDHFENTVPVFRPTIKQFQDFQKFVRCSCLPP
jgi:hypothetical protein